MRSVRMLQTHLCQLLGGWKLLAQNPQHKEEALLYLKTGQPAPWLGKILSASMAGHPTPLYGQMLVSDVGAQILLISQRLLFKRQVLYLALEPKCCVDKS